MPEYINVTPTWDQILDVLIMILKNGDDEGQRKVEQELRRMATAADNWNNYVASYNKDHQNG